MEHIDKLKKSDSQNAKKLRHKGIQSELPRDENLMLSFTIQLAAQKFFVPARKT